MKIRKPTDFSVPILMKDVPRSHFQGMLLEEALLFLLEYSGYNVTYSSHSDPTLSGPPGSLKIFGRTGTHQIDAVADFQISPPFSLPQRLLVEAKCQKSCKVNRDTILKAIAVIRDIREGQLIHSKSSFKTNIYHYQYAIFSANGFEDKAEHYAISNDIYPIPLHKSKFITPIIDSIFEIANLFVKEGEYDGQNLPIGGISRMEIRNALRGEEETNDVFPELWETIRINSRREEDWKYMNMYKTIHNKLISFIEECKKIKGSYLAVLGGRFPVFLTPKPGFDIVSFNESTKVRIYWKDDSYWYLVDDQSGIELFSFDLPEDILKTYNKEDLLKPGINLQIKGDFMSNFSAFYMNQRKEVHVKWFRLDKEWLNSLINKIG